MHETRITRQKSILVIASEALKLTKKLIKHILHSVPHPSPVQEVLIMKIEKEFPADTSDGVAPPFKNNGRLLLTEESEADVAIVLSLREQGLGLKLTKIDEKNIRCSVSLGDTQSAVWISAKTADLCNSILNRLRTSIRQRAK